MEDSLEWQNSCFDARTHFKINAKNAKVKIPFLCKLLLQLTHLSLCGWDAYYCLLLPPHPLKFFPRIKSFRQFSKKLSHYLCVWCVRSSFNKLSSFTVTWLEFLQTQWFLVPSFISLRSKCFSAAVYLKGENWDSTNNPNTPWTFVFLICMDGCVVTNVEIYPEFGISLERGKETIKRFVDKFKSYKIPWQQPNIYYRFSSWTPNARYS